MKRYRMYINGEFVPSVSGKMFPVYEPATEEIMAYAPDGSADDVSCAVAAARIAFDDSGWRDVTAQERGRILFRIADKIPCYATSI